MFSRYHSKILRNRKSQGKALMALFSTQHFSPIELLILVVTISNPHTEGPNFGSCVEKESSFYYYQRKFTINQIYIYLYTV